MTHRRAGTKVGATQQFLHIVAVCVGCGLAHIGTSTMPFQIGALVDGTHRSASEAGLFGFVQVGALAAGMILISPWVDRIAPRRIAVGSCLLAALANTGLYFLHVLPLQLVFAALAGLDTDSYSQRPFPVQQPRASPTGCMRSETAARCSSSFPSWLSCPWPRHVWAHSAYLRHSVHWRSSPHLFSWVSPQAGPWRRRGSRLACPGLRVFYLHGRRSPPHGCAVCVFGAHRQSINLPPAQIALVLSAGVFVGLVGTAVAACWVGGSTAPGLGHRPVRERLVLPAAGVRSQSRGIRRGRVRVLVFYMFLYSYLLGTAAVLDPAGRVGTLAGVWSV